MMGFIFVGMALFFQADLSPSGVWGNLISVFSGICLATMLISLRLQKDSGAAETLILGNMIAFVVGMIWIPNNEVNLKEGAIIFYLGVIQLGLPFILLTQAIKVLTAVETVLIQTLEPILSPIWVAIIILEFPSPIAFVGAFLVLTAVLLNVWQSEETNEKGHCG